MWYEVIVGVLAFITLVFIWVIVDDGNKSDHHNKWKNLEREVILDERC